MMLGDARGVMSNGARWTVREVDASRVPGAQADRCLVFEGDGVLRRAWIYPANWADLPERDLASVMQSRDAAVGAREQRDEIGDPLSALMAQSNAIIAQTRAVVHAAKAALHDNVALRQERRELLERARGARDEMRTAVQAYARSLRQAGVASDQAIGLVLSAARNAFVGLSPVQGVDAGAVLSETVGWCREVYEAA
ncbi:MAG: hypothetical protein ACHQWU_11070 [Gemmatimonadales bacterium]